MLFRQSEEEIMPLSNMFKKPPNKDTSKNISSDENLLSSKQQKIRSEAAKEFLNVFQEKMPLVGGQPHAGTVISIAARLAGTSLFWSINKNDITPDVIVLSEEVNKAYPQLLNQFARYCKRSGIDVRSKPVVTDFPELDKPLMDIAQIRAEYQDPYNKIMKKHGLDFLEGAWAGMIVCSIVFEFHCISKKDIDPYIATGIVAMGVVEGAKTSPTSRSSDKIKTEMDSISQSVQEKFSRFVIGNLEDIIPDVNKNGGQYTQLHPLVEQKLKDGNIDPKVIYIQGLETQLEEKVSRVDFINMDIDEILRQEQNDQMPIHVLLVYWLNEKAEEYSYKKSGNSWILKS